MRQQAWNEVKIALFDYPNYDAYINSVRQSKLYPYKQSDENIGGGKSSGGKGGLDNTVIALADDVLLRRLIFQRDTIKRRLDLSPEWVRDMISLMYFSSNRLPISKACDFVGRDRRTCKKYHEEFVSNLAGDLGILKG